MLNLGPEAKATLERALARLKEKARRFCPVDGVALEHTGDNPHVHCGALKYFRCPACNRYFRESQRGVLARRPDLAEIPAPRDASDLKAWMRLDLVYP